MQRREMGTSTRQFSCLHTSLIQLVKEVVEEVGSIADSCSGARSPLLTTAVILLALAILQAWHRIMVSMRAALVGVKEEEAVLGGWV